MNRIDEIILFKRLGRAQMDSIVSIQLRRVEKLLAGEIADGQVIQVNADSDGLKIGKVTLQ